MRSIVGFLAFTQESTWQMLKMHWNSMWKKVFFFKTKKCSISSSIDFEFCILSMFLPLGFWFFVLCFYQARMFSFVGMRKCEFASKCDFRSHLSCLLLLPPCFTFYYYHRRPWSLLLPLVLTHKILTCFVLLARTWQGMVVVVVVWMD